MKYLLLSILLTISSCTKDESNDSNCYNVYKVLHNKTCVESNKILNIKITKESNKEYIIMNRTNGTAWKKYELLKIECNNLLVIDSADNIKRYIQLEHANDNGFFLNDLRYYYKY